VFLVLWTKLILPRSSPALGPSGNLAASLKANANLNSGPTIPWRRSNVRHTSNELYVDIVETLNVVLAPSGRPISAMAAGSIAFTAKISGVPDLILSLTAPGGNSSAKAAGIFRTMQLPTFHPCVRLARWREHPGELSFVPPDGRFMLAGYEVDLLPSSLNTNQPPSQKEKLFLPVSVELRTGLGPSGSDFEARLTLNTNYPGVQAQSRAGPSRSTSSKPFSFGSASGGSSNTPSLEGVIVTIPFAANVRSVVELKVSRGEANYLSWDKIVEWKVPTKDGASINGVATLSGSLVGPISADDDDNDLDFAEQAKTNSLLGYYDEDSTAITQQHHSNTNGADSNMPASSIAMQQRRTMANRALMPRSALVSFTVRGWLPSGIKVDSLFVDVNKSKGLGEGVKPFKGVKYITVSRQGIERRA
jgi:AP-3 complex subunit mu